jgi:hypothetical protein
MAEQQIGANKEEAERLRLKTYHGTPCEKGHTKRYTKGGKCFECSAEALRRNRKKAKAAKTGKVTKGRAVVATEKPTSGWEGLARRARALIEKADNAAEKAEQFYKSAGLTIKEIKDKFPKQWEAIVRDEIHIGRSRAYELMLIADGKATLATIRQRTNERQKALKAKSSVITDRPAVSPAPRSLREAILYGGLGHEETPPPRAESAGRRSKLGAHSA